jgi:hypothetical protein
VGNALVRFDARQHARPSSISKRARTTTPTWMREVLLNSYVPRGDSPAALQAELHGFLMVAFLPPELGRRHRMRTAAAAFILVGLVASPLTAQERDRAQGIPQVICRHLKSAGCGTTIALRVSNRRPSAIVRLNVSRRAIATRA